MPVTALREVRILQSSRHKNIVNLLRVVNGKKPNAIFLVFEYCEHDLARLLETMRVPFTEAESKCLCLQLLQAVEYLHRRWVFHRDLKLSNLLLNNRGELKLCDFGLVHDLKTGPAKGKARGRHHRGDDSARTRPPPPRRRPPLRHRRSSPAAPRCVL